MKTRIKGKGLIFALIVALAACLAGGVATLERVQAAQTIYYVCFASENNAVKITNKMEEQADGSYLLENKTLPAFDRFYVTDNAGVRYYGSNDEPVSIRETGTHAYDIGFLPTSLYDGTQESWTETGSHISYRFFTPVERVIYINGEERALNYNPYHTGYELYYLSSVELQAEDIVTCLHSPLPLPESHTVEADGFYRILFTPDKVSGGETYRFDEAGRYGTGDGYDYNLYLESAPQYFVCFEETPFGLAEEETYFPLTRYEKNVTEAEYRSDEFFFGERDKSVGYALYEEVDGVYRSLGDGVGYSSLTAQDAGWHRLSVTEIASSYHGALTDEERDFGGFFAVGDFNGYGYNAVGEVNAGGEYAFSQMLSDDEDYDPDYRQYVLYFTLTEEDLRGGGVEFYITDGRDKYKDGTKYILLNTEGCYKIVFSEEHIYSRGRHYRYILEAEEGERTELVLRTVEEFIHFAEACSFSADYSVNMKVYLAADLDFKGTSFVPVKSFSGVFYGGYHTLKNISSGENECAAVFETVTRTALIERLNVENLDLSGEDYVGFVNRNYGTLSNITLSGNLSGKRYVGGLCAYNGRSVKDENAPTTDSSNVFSYALIKNCVSNATVRGESNLGGIAGFSSGYIEGCRSAGKVIGEKRSSSATVLSVGGVVGNTNYRVTDCENASAVSSGGASLYVGGIAGLSSGEIYYCANRAEISGTRYVGGICGYYGAIQENGQDLENYFKGLDYESFLNEYFGGGETVFPEEEDNATHRVMYCVNGAQVTAIAYAGGVLGAAPATKLYLYHCASSGNVLVTAGNYAGGIAGYASNVEICSAASTGRISAKGLNSGNYVGGIAGYAPDILYCVSAATVEGADYAGGIAGSAEGKLVGCYSNALVISSGQDALHLGSIAGFCAGYNVSLNSFDDVRGNYYIGELGGIEGTDYAGQFDYAAARIESDKLASEGTLSPYLCASFVSEYWQGGQERSYPTLYYFENVQACADFGDAARWGALFAAHREEYAQLIYDVSRITYTVVFREWNKNNGELIENGEIAYHNFDVVAAVRLAAGERVQAPAFLFAEDNGRGDFVYEGAKARYFVTMKDDFVVTQDMTVYAEYAQIVTSIAGGDGEWFLEGEFYPDTKVEMVRTGDYFTFRLTRGETEVFVENITVKLKEEDVEHTEIYLLREGEREKLEHEVSGDYVAFRFTSGQYFVAEEREIANLPYWIWLFIGIGSGAAVCIFATLVVFLVKKRRSRGGKNK